MPYIKTIPPSEATGKLKESLRAVSGPSAARGKVAMVRQVQSLHPDALAAWSDLGAAIMHGPSQSDAAPARNDRHRGVGDQSLQLLNDRARRGSP